MIKSLFIVLTIAFAPALATVMGKPLQCQSDIRKALNEGHFTGPLVCSRTDASFVFIGRTSETDFTIYDYRYRFRPLEDGVMHGGQKLIVFQHGKYIGQYPLSPPPYTGITIDKTNVILEIKETKEKVALDFSTSPPKEVLINGEVEVFSR